MDPKNLEFLKNLAKGIISIFGDRCEIVIHDFKDLKRSLVYINGNITHRQLGCPLPDTLYRLLKEFGEDAPDKFGYKGTTKDGKILKCSTTMVRNSAGKLEGCLCINFNITDFVFLSTAFNDFTFNNNKNGRDDGNGTNQNGTASTFAESMESAIDCEINEYGKVPTMMDKSDKLVIMQRLDKEGVFMIKGSVDYMAKVFGSSRYTIYNYLKQIRT